MSTTTDLARRGEARLEAGLADGNGVIDPARWQMLAAIAETVKETEFVPAGLRNSSPKVLACLLYGDSIGLHPMTALKEIHVIDGVPGMSAALMSGLVRRAGHKLKREEIRDASGNFLGVKVSGKRSDTGETDEYTFTLAMATRAGLMSKHNWKSYPEAMCSARAFSQICTFLFPDVFMGSPYTGEEIETFQTAEATVLAGAPDGSPIAKPPAAEEPAAGEAGQNEGGEQTLWDVVDEQGRVVARVDADEREAIKGSGAKFAKFPNVDGRFELLGYEVDGETQVEKIMVREAADGGARAGSPEAAVSETIPKIMELVLAAKDRGDRPFIEGVLAAEQKGKNRPRLVKQLDDLLALIPTGAPAPVQDAAGGELEQIKAWLANSGSYNEDGTPADEETARMEARFAELGDGELFHNEEETAEEVAARAAALSFQPVDTEPALPVAEVELNPAIPYSNASHRAKIVRLRALAGYMADQHPEAKAWQHASLVAAAAKQWGGTIESIDDFEEYQLDAVWAAAEQHVPDAVQYLAIVNVDDLVKLSDQATA